MTIGLHIGQHVLEHFYYRRNLHWTELPQALAQYGHLPLLTPLEHTNTLQSANLRKLAFSICLLILILPLTTLLHLLFREHLYQQVSDQSPHTIL